MSDKLQKTDSAIVPASKIADKIASALKDEGKLAARGRSLLDRPRYVYSFDVSNRSEPFADCSIYRISNTGAQGGVTVRLDAEGRYSWRSKLGMYLSPGERLVAEIEDRNSLGKPSAGTCFAYTICVVGERQLGERQMYGVSMGEDGDDTYALLPDTADPVGPVEEIAAYSDDTMRSFMSNLGRAAGRQAAKVARFGEIVERSGMSPPSVTLPTESSMKRFDIKVIGADGNPVELSPEVEMPDLRVGCGAEFSVPVNGKTLRCTKWRGHKGDHSDKINGVPINWANK